MIFRRATMTVWDQFHVFRLYREFLLSEPCSVLLDLAACGLDTRPGILTSLSSLTAAGGVILCLEEGGMGALGNMIMSC